MCVCVRVCVCVCVVSKLSGRKVVVVYVIGSHEGESGSHEVVHSWVWKVIGGERRGGR